MPAWLDNAFHSHGKRELVTCAVDGLLARAISRSSDLLSDGWVEASWVRKQLRPSERKRVIELAVEHGILEPLPAGEARALRGRPRPGLRSEEVYVTVGPHATDGYIVHDFLDCNWARAEVEARRQRDRERQRKRRNGRRQEPLPPAAEDWWQTSLDGESPPSCHASHTCDNTCDTRDRDRGVKTPTSEDEDLNDARAPERSSDPVVQEVLDVLSSATRLRIDPVAVENAIRAFPGGDPVTAAREVVSVGTDPQRWQTWASSLLWKALERQTQPKEPAVNGHRRKRATAADFLAMRKQEAAAR